MMDETLIPYDPDGAVAVFNNGYSAFVRDDHCYVLKNFVVDEWRTSAHLFREALEVLKSLPANPDGFVWPKLPEDAA